MFRSILCAAVAAAAISLAVPAQAAMSDPGLNAAAPATLQLAYYYHHHHHYYYPHHHWWHSYAYVPYRHCWSERVWSWGGWRWVRRCD